MYLTMEELKKSLDDCRKRIMRGDITFNDLHDEMHNNLIYKNINLWQMAELVATGYAYIDAMPEYKNFLYYVHNKHALLAYLYRKLPTNTSSTDILDVNYVLRGMLELDFWGYPLPLNVTPEYIVYNTEILLYAEVAYKQQRDIKDKMNSILFTTDMSHGPHSIKLEWEIFIHNIIKQGENKICM